MSKTMHELNLIVPEGIFPVSIARAIYEKAEEERFEVQNQLYKVLVTKYRDGKASLITAKNVKDSIADIIPLHARLEVCENACREASEQVKKFNG